MFHFQGIEILMLSKLAPLNVSLDDRYPNGH